MAAKEEDTKIDTKTYPVRKKVFICHPNDPDPNNASHEYALYKKKIFLETVSMFVECLGAQPGIEVCCKTDFCSEEFDYVKTSEMIQISDCILVICCPALVYLLSNSARDFDRLKENQTMIELRSILGQLLIDNRSRLIPVFLNTHSDNIENNLPPEMRVNTTPVRVCIATLPDGEEEYWAAQQHSIDRLVRIIHMETFQEIPQSPITEIDVVDQDWCFHFMDQYVIDFISGIFEDRRIETDNKVLKKFLKLDPDENKSFRELLRIWLRGLGKKSGVYSLFEELRVILGELGREDLMYQMKAQFEIYKNEVYYEQSQQSCPVSHPQAKALVPKLN